MFITERIKNLIEEGQYTPSLRILLTTFNKNLIKCLGDWLVEVLDKTKIKRTFTGDSESWFCFQGCKSPSLYLYHFNILPTRIGKLKGDIKKGIVPITHEEIHSHLMKRSLDAFNNDNSFHEIKDFATPSFLLDEYHRIVYGYNINSEKEYQTLRRRGRGTPLLAYNSNKRQLVYKIIVKYLEILEEKGYDSFTTMRKRFLKKLEHGELNENEKFTHIFVDELQDCTYADYQIFYKLLKKDHHKNIVFAGDLAQSIQLGTALYIPKAEDVMMGNWENNFLEGSYRLPFRISEAIFDLSKQINTRFGTREGLEVSIISPYRGAPPGSRIIFLYAESELKMVQKIKCVYKDYKIFFRDGNFPPITVYEGDYAIVRAIRQEGLKVEDEHILRSKGMEKKFVFWSTRTNIESENEVYEFVYTILTRTCSMLVIGLSDNTIPVFYKIIILSGEIELLCGTNLQKRNSKVFVRSLK